MRAKPLLDSPFLNNYYFIILVSAIFSLISLNSNESLFSPLNFLIEIINSFNFYSLVIVISLCSFSLLLCHSNKAFLSLEHEWDFYTLGGYAIAGAFKFIIIIFVWLIKYLPTTTFYIWIFNILISIFLLFYITAILGFIFFFVKSYLNKIKTPANREHWIDSYLDSNQLSIKRTITSEGKASSVFADELIIDEENNKIQYKRKTYNLNSFKEFINIKNCKLHELTDDDWSIIEMMSI